MSEGKLKIVNKIKKSLADCSIKELYNVFYALSIEKVKLYIADDEGAVHERTYEGSIWSKVLEKIYDDIDINEKYLYFSVNDYLLEDVFFNEKMAQLKAKKNLLSVLQKEREGRLNIEKRTEKEIKELDKKIVNLIKETKEFKQTLNNNRK